MQHALLFDVSVIDIVSVAAVLGKLGKGVSWRPSPPNSWQVRLAGLKRQQCNLLWWEGERYRCCATGGGCC